MEAAAETRERLFEAASSLFRRVGYHAATLEQVARDAGHTKGAVYSAFASKADLFLELVARRAAARRDEVRQVRAGLSAGQEDSEAFARAAATHMARSATEEAGYWASVIEFMTVVARDEALRERYAEHHDATRETLATTIQGWAEASGEELLLPARTVATIVLALTNGLTLEGMLSPRELPASAFVDAQVALMRGCLRPAREAAGNPREGEQP